LIDIMEKFFLYIQNNSKEHFYNETKKENIEKIIELFKSSNKNKDDNDNNINDDIIKTENINNLNEKEKINNEKIIENINNDNLSKKKSDKQIITNNDITNSSKNKYLHEISFQEYKLQTMLYFNKYICRQHYLLKQMTPEDILLVITQMKDEFPEITKEIDIKKEQYKIEIYEYIESIFENSKINLEIEKHFFKFLKDSEEYIIFFLSLLNINRTNNKYKLNNISFDKFVEIFNFILDNEYKKENINIEIFNYIIIMSQTYCYEDENNNKIFIQKNIQNHKIFKDMNNWEKSLYHQINEDLTISNKYNTGLNKEELKQRKENIVFSKFLSIIHNLIEFDIDKNFIKEFINKIKNSFKDIDINKNIDIINNLVNNSNKKQ